MESSEALAARDKSAVASNQTDGTKGYIYDRYVKQM